MGFIIASLAPTVRVAETVGMAIYFPMIFLSGATIPVQVMPDTLTKITNILPLTHIVKLMQGLWYGNFRNHFLLFTLRKSRILLWFSIFSRKFE
ncbi:MAG: ABC transporter permease [Spirochaetales bacterium]|nr:ABC transporter permease [Spirochaetales bacterium]